MAETTTDNHKLRTLDPIVNPDHKKLEEAVEDVKFQLDNVIGWLHSKKYEAAEIKSQYVIKAAQRLQLALEDYVKLTYADKMGEG